MNAKGEGCSEGPASDEEGSLKRSAEVESEIVQAGDEVALPEFKKATAGNEVRPTGGDRRVGIENPEAGLVLERVDEDIPAEKRCGPVKLKSTEGDDGIWKRHPGIGTGGKDERGKTTAEVEITSDRSGAGIEFDAVGEAGKPDLRKVGGQCSDGQGSGRPLVRQFQTSGNGSGVKHPGTHRETGVKGLQFENAGSTFRDHESAGQVEIDELDDRARIEQPEEVGGQGDRETFGIHHHRKIKVSWGGIELILEGIGQGDSGDVQGGVANGISGDPVVEEEQGPGEIGQGGEALPEAGAPLRNEGRDLAAGGFFEEEIAGKTRPVGDESGILSKEFGEGAGRQVENDRVAADAEGLIDG